MAAKEAGFEAVEFWWPFSASVPPDGEVEAFAEAVAEAGVTLVNLNFFAGDRAAGERGLVSWPGRKNEFRENVELTVALGKRLGCTSFNALYGNRLPDSSPEEQDEHAMVQLVFAAEAVRRIGGVVLVEPVSGADAYPLRTAADAVGVMERVEGSAEVSELRLLADLYHLVVNGDNIDQVFARHMDRIGHVQIADAPGRHEPGTGGLPLGTWLSELRSSGYQGWIALEYAATGATVDSFAGLP